MTTISTKSDEGALVITSNDGELNSASAVLLLKATNPEYNQPVLHIKQASKDGDAASDGALKYMGSKGTITTIAPA